MIFTLCLLFIYRYSLAKVDQSRHVLYSSRHGKSTNICENRIEVTNAQVEISALPRKLVVAKVEFVALSASFNFPIKSFGKIF